MNISPKKISLQRHVGHGIKIFPHSSSTLSTSIGRSPWDSCVAKIVNSASSSASASVTTATTTPSTTSSTLSTLLSCNCVKNSSTQHSYKENLNNTPTQQPTICSCVPNLTTTLAPSHSWDKRQASNSTYTKDPSSKQRQKRRKRKYEVKKCSIEGCKNGARSKGLCKGHGGGKRCQQQNCDASDQGGGFCISHGGGRRCTVQGCKNGVQSRGLCKNHGGGRRCAIVGCTKSSQGEGLCRAHGGGKRCLQEGCTNLGTKHRKGLCKEHGQGRVALKKLALLHTTSNTQNGMNEVYTNPNNTTQCDYFPKMKSEEKSKLLTTEDCDDIMLLLGDTTEYMHSSPTFLERGNPLNVLNIEPTLEMFTSIQDNVEMDMAIQEILKDDFPLLENYIVESMPSSSVPFSTCMGTKEFPSIVDNGYTKINNFLLSVDCGVPCYDFL